MSIERRRRVNILVSDEELEMLSSLARQDGLTVSDYLRLSIRKDFDQRVKGAPLDRTKKPAK